MPPARTLAAAVTGYLLGSIPSADLATRAATRGALDLREHGSGNPGATNAAAVLGRGWGGAVLAADVTKGTAAGILGRRLAGANGAYAAATGSILGHVFPIWKRFRGGKGVATSAGACLAVFPAYSAIDAAVAGATATGAPHLKGAMTATCALWIGAATLWWKRDLPNGWGPEPTGGLVGFAAAGSAAILWKFWTAPPVPPHA